MEAFIIRCSHDTKRDYYNDTTMTMIQQRSLFLLSLIRRPQQSRLLRNGERKAGTGSELLLLFSSNTALGGTKEKEEEEKDVGGGGYKSIGSFHSAKMSDILDNIVAEKNNGRGNVPFDLPSSIAEQYKSYDYGSPEFRTTTGSGGNGNTNYFQLDLTKWTFLNHGAFGATTTYALQVANQWRAYAEQQPLLFFDREFMRYYGHNLYSLCSILGVPAHHLHTITFVPNATYGLNSVIKSIPIATNDVIVCFDTTYGSVKTMLQNRCNETKKKDGNNDDNGSNHSNNGNAAIVHQIDTSHIIMEHNSSIKEQLLDAFQTVVDEYRREGRRNIALVVLDHVSSNTALRYPIEEIISYCRRSNQDNTNEQHIPILVDGAHGLLNLDLNLDQLQADYYVGNCHKWFAAPKGCGFLYVHPNPKRKRNETDSTNKNINTDTTAIPILNHINPPIISHGYTGDFTERFVWDGLRDVSSYLTISECIHEWNILADGDMNKLRSYNHELVYDGVRVSILLLPFFSYN